jgi:hypothetical protein
MVLANADKKLIQGLSKLFSEPARKSSQEFATPTGERAETLIKYHGIRGR